MAYVKWQLGVLKFNQNTFTWSDTPIYLDSFTEPEVTESIGEDKDSFSFNVPITAGLDDDTLQMNDRVIIKRSINGEDFESIRPLMIGRISDVGPTVDYKSKLFEVEGFNYSEAVADLLIFVNANELTPPEAMERALETAAAESETFRVTWHPDNPTVKTDGTPFEKIGERIYYRPMKYLMRKYSTEEFTGDVPYYWYINENDQLVWEPMTTEIKEGFDAREDTFISFDQGLDKDGMINYVIVKGGELPSGRQVSIRRESSLSNSRHGRKYKIIPSIAENAGVLNDQDMKSLGYTDRSYPKSEDYDGGFTTTWFNKRDQEFSTVFSDEEYDRVLREHVEFMAIKEAEQVLDERKFARVEATIVVQPQERLWGLGDQVRVFAPRTGDFKDLRVMSVKYGQQQDRYYLREDRGSF